MIRITGRGLVRDAPAAHYSVAGQALACQNQMNGLDAYATGLATRSFTDILKKFAELPLMNEANAELRYSGKAYMDGSFRQVRFWRSKMRGQLDVDGTPACQIDFNECHIHVLNENELGSGLNLELVTGPALVLLLGRCDTYCMHAGAVDTEVGRIGIMAESGVGKSTLSNHAGDHWSQVSDDIMPVKLVESTGNIEVLPDFPQLKLSNNMVSSGRQKKRNLDFLIRLNSEPSESIQFNVLPKLDAMLQVIRHTVAAKLFDTDMLEKHAAFAKYVSLLVPVIELSYPRDLDKLEHLREAILEYVGKLD